MNLKAQMNQAGQKYDPQEIFEEILNKTFKVSPVFEEKTKDLVIQITDYTKKKRYAWKISFQNPGYQSGENLSAPNHLEMSDTELAGILRQQLDIENAMMIGKIRFSGDPKALQNFGKLLIN